MKKTRIFALVLALCLALTACNSGRDTASIASYDGKTVPAGVYLYSLTSAYGEAAAKRDDTEGELLSGTVEGVPAADWIRDDALNIVKEFVGAEQLYAQQGLSFDEATAAEIKSSQDSMWNYYGSTLEDKGIARSSLDAVVENIYKRSAVLHALYGEGGEQELTDEELRAYYSDNYRRVEMLAVMKAGVADEDKETVAGLLDSYYDRAVAGEEMLTLIAEEYARQTGSTVEDAAAAVGGDQTVLVSRDTTGYPAALIEQIFATSETGTPQKYTSDDFDVLFVVHDLFEGDMANADYLAEYDTLLEGAAKDDFAARLAAAADDAGYKLNDKAVQRYKVADVVA